MCTRDDFKYALIIPLYGFECDAERIELDDLGMSIWLRRSTDESTVANEVSPLGCAVEY